MNPNDHVAQLAARLLAVASASGRPDGEFSLVLTAGLVLAMQMLMRML